MQFLLIFLKKQLFFSFFDSFVQLLNQSLMCTLLLYFSSLPSHIIAPPLISLKFSVHTFRLNGALVYIYILITEQSVELLRGALPLQVHNLFVVQELECLNLPLKRVDTAVALSLLISVHWCILLYICMLFVMWLLFS